MKPKPHITFVTGNKDKATALQKWLDFTITMHPLELDEIQSVDVRKVSEHKARQAFSVLKSPVLVEDVGVSFTALNGLPGAFIKWFVDYAGLDTTCSMLDGFSDRSALAICVWTYYDGTSLLQIEGYQKGVIANKPHGTGGFGWDALFIPNGYTIIRAEMPEDLYKKVYTDSKNYPGVRDLLYNLQT